MYSLVLMTAMTAAPDATGNGFFRNLFGGGCDGCSGCCGGAARYGCGGYSDSSGCCGGCNGCCGGSGFLGLGLFRRSSYSCSGCCGGSSYSCTGYSCGGAVAYSCYGSSPAVSYTPVFNAGLTCYGGPTPSAPPPVFGPAPTMPYANPEAAPAFDPNRTGFRPAAFAQTTANGSTGRGTVVIRLPADARLFADNTALRMTGPERKFVTPELAADMEYTYRFRAEYDRDGETISVTKKVAVRPGQTAAVEFTDLMARGGNPGPTATPVSNPAPADRPVPPVTPPAAPPKPDAVPPAADRATITVKLPPGATLYVDNRKDPAGSPVREFNTPPLPTGGREFAYLMKAEVVRDGRPEYLIQKVAFRAGDRITVDFTSAGLGR